MGIFNPTREPDRFKDMSSMSLLRDVKEYGDWLDRGGFLTRRTIDNYLQNGDWALYPPPREYPCFVFTNVRNKMPTFIYLDDAKEALQILKGYVL